MAEMDTYGSGPESTAPSLGNKSGGVRAVVLFVLILAAYVIQSQLTQHVQTDLGYRQPYFIFYLAHSSFVAIFPLHLLYLKIATGIPTSQYVSSLNAAVIRHLGSPSSSASAALRLARLVFALTLGSTTTALLWYIAVAFAPISDVTALFNTNAFWAYVLSVLCGAGAHESRWEARKLMSVVIACAGVFSVVYGGSQTSQHKPDAEHRRDGASLSWTVVGDALALAGSISYALYQVFYSRFAVLSPDADPHFASPATSSTGRGPYQPLLHNQDEEGEPDVTSKDTTHDLPPFALHPNFLTSLIGVTTLLFFWIPIPVMFWLGVGPAFELPADAKIWGYIALVAITGIVFNGGFMVLLGIWGPVVVSVGNLLTIVLVVLSDAGFGNGVKTLTVWSLLGSGMIVGAFSVLAVDMMNG